MRRKRQMLAIAGVLLIGFGVFRLVTQIPWGSLLWVAVWLIAAVVVHDGIIAPTTLGVGVLLQRIPPRARRYVQGGVIAGALVTAIAVPLIARRGSQRPAKALLERNYAAGLGLVLGLIAVAVVLAWTLRVVRDRVTARREPPAGDAGAGSNHDPGS